MPLNSMKIGYICKINLFFADIPFFHDSGIHEDFKVKKQLGNPDYLSYLRRENNCRQLCVS